VTEGSAVVGASKVDASLHRPDHAGEFAVRAGAVGRRTAPTHLAVTDSLTYETGGSLVIADGQVDRLRATYTNWDKLEGGESVCRYIFLFGRRLSTPVGLGDLSAGVTFTEDYTADGLGMITYTVSADVVDNVFVEGFRGGGRVPASRPTWTAATAASRPLTRRRAARSRPPPADPVSESHPLHSRPGSSGGVCLPARLSPGPRRRGGARGPTSTGTDAAGSAPPRRR
jgi:hypothetical protein